MLVVLVERFAFRTRVGVPTQVVNKLAARDIAGPSYAIGKDGQECIVGRRSFHSPALVTDHDLACGEAFLGPSDEDAAQKFGQIDHKARLPEPEILPPFVVHIANRVAQTLRKFKPALEHQAKVAQIRFGL